FAVVLFAGGDPASRGVPSDFPARSAVAVTRLSGPALFCSSPMASERAMRAFIRAAAIASPLPEFLKEIVDKDISPMARIVRRTINERHVTSANPSGCDVFRRSGNFKVLMGFIVRS